MTYYHRMGALPHKRHTQFRKADGTLRTLFAHKSALAAYKKNPGMLDKPGSAKKLLPLKYKFCVS